jgi:TetR/AcrR family transcriptional regulator, cholesterol catabolism regulator
MADHLRSNIQKTATKLFLKYGLRSISIDDICNELRISKKTFYTQFTQKEELIESVLVEHNAKRIKKHECSRNLCQCPGNAIDYILASSAIHKSPQNKQFMNIFFDLNKYYPDLHKRLIQLNHEKACNGIHENILKGQEEGLFRSDIDVDLMSRFLALQFMTMLNTTSKDLSKTTLQQGFELIMDIHIRVLCNQKGLDYYEQLLKTKPVEKTTDDTPIKDEEIDAIVEQFFSNTEDILQSTKHTTQNKK